MPFCFSLKIMTLCQTLSNTFKIWRKTSFTSNPSSKDLYILWYIKKGWLIQEFPGFKPDWFLEIKLFPIRNLDISFNTSLKFFFTNWKLWDCSVIFQIFFIIFLMNWNHISIFPFYGKEPVLIHGLNRKFWSCEYGSCHDRELYLDLSFV